MNLLKKIAGLFKGPSSSPGPKALEVEPIPAGTKIALEGGTTKRVEGILTGDKVHTKEGAIPVTQVIKPAPKPRALEVEPEPRPKKIPDPKPVPVPDPEPAPAPPPVIGDSILEELETLTKNLDTSKLPAALQDDFQYKENFKAFDEYSKMHRDHQRDALKVLKGKDIGQVTIPTGTGKTRIQVSLHVEDMIAKTKKGKTGVYVISAHRLALCSQLLEDLIEIAIMCGLKFDLLYVGSERFNDDKVHFHYRSQGFTKYVANTTNTTSKFDVQKAAETAKNLNRHLLVVSTYHSFHKLETIPEIDICTYDEAHIALQDNFTENISLIKERIKREFFFTATRKVFGEDLGMNDESFFGEVLYEQPPKEMVERGEIVPPKIHSIRLDGDPVETGDLENMSMMRRVITEGFVNHRAAIKRYSKYPKKLGAKLLVTFRGSKDMMALHDDPEFRVWCRSQKVNVVLVSSAHGNYFNFEDTRRSKVIDIMGDLKDEEDALLFHIDILTEGIDLPSITGVLPFRDLSKSKLLQNIGRGARLLKEDRKNLYGGKIKPKEYDKMVKPYCWVLLSEDIFVEFEQIKRIERILYDIINEYDVPVEELFVTDNFRGDVEDDLDRMTEQDESSTVDKECKLRHLINKMLSDRFRDDIRLDPDPIGRIYKELKDLPNKLSRREIKRFLDALKDHPDPLGEIKKQLTSL